VDIGKTIKENRTKKGETQEDLSNYLYVSRQLVSKWENGKSYPDLNQLIQLSDHYNLSLDELMRGNKKMLDKKDSQIKLFRKSKKIELILIAMLIFGSLYNQILTYKTNSLWNGNSFFDKFYKVQNFLPYAIPIVLDNEPPRM
jgi:transcriptional regulator with XRE-family HTH domain